MSEHPVSTAAEPASRSSASTIRGDSQVAPTAGRAGWWPRIVTRMVSKNALLSMLEVALPVIMAVAAVYFMAVSVFWRPNHDAPLMYYIGYLMESRGAVPYVDFFDMNAPGTMLLHQGVAKLVGTSEMGQRLVDLSVLVAIQSAVFVYMRRWGWTVALMSISCFTLHLLGSGASETFQREFVCILPIVLSLCVAFRGDRWTLSQRAFTLGLLYGAILTVKPPLVLAHPVVLLALLVSRVEKSSLSGLPRLQHLMAQRSTWQALVWSGVGLMVCPSLCIGYLIKVGAFAAFLELSGEYWPLYAQLRGDGSVRADPFEAKRFLWLAHQTISYSFLGVMAMGLFATVPRLIRESRRDATEIFTLLALLSVFWAHIFISGKFWVYHSLPAFLIYSLVAGLTLWTVGQSRRFPLEMTARVFALAVFALMAWKTPEQAERILEGKPFLIHREIDHVANLLRDTLEPGDSVQPLDVTEGAVHAMLLAKADLATPFLYDFHFYHHPRNPFIQKLRARFLAAMKSTRPRFIIAAVRNPWRPRGPKTIRDFVGLKRLVARNYEPVWKGKSLALYERKSAD